ncbi:MAG TPA: hypothetical protein VMW16_14255 [Sedimentisphaerales bacterium]|nr:hypothetical protein [Sedimentisphaerales bacterium]
MIKTLRITSIIAAIVGAGLLIFPAVFGFRGDEEIERFLSSPGALERFKQAEGGRSRAGENQISPLVKQAEAFALYLNPPKVERAEQRGSARPAQRPREVIPAPTISTAKFTVVATSFHESVPELSLALIDEPGSGRHWVRQSSVINHLTVEQIKDGVVVLKGPQGPIEMAVEPRPVRRSLLAGSAPLSMGTAGQAVPTYAPDAGSIRATAAAADGTQPQEDQADADAVAQKVFAELMATAAAESGGADSTQPAEQELQQTDKPVPDVESGRITGEEADKLDRLGRELQNVGQDERLAKIRADRQYRQVRTDRTAAAQGTGSKDARAERRARMAKERMERARALAERARANRAKAGAEKENQDK